MPLNTNIPRSGLVAAERRQAASAHNTANLNTDGVSHQRVSSQARPTGSGVDTTVDTVELSDAGREIAQTVEGPQNNIDAANSECFASLDARDPHSAGWDHQRAGQIAVGDVFAQGPFYERVPCMSRGHCSGHSQSV